jgi:hypothetical protein
MQLIKFLHGQVAIERTSFSAGNLKGQVATEFMLYTSLFIVVAIAAFLVVADLQRSEIQAQENKVVKEVGDNFVNAITLSVKGGEGFSYTYNFQKTLFNIPYTVYFENTNSENASIVIEWAGSYGNFSYVYYVPAYTYQFGGTCFADSILISDQCGNILTLYNDGENLIITQEE